MTSPGTGRRSYVDRLLKADALVFSFPVWNMGFPAISRVSSTRFSARRQLRYKSDGDHALCLHNIKRLGVVCTYGGSRWITFLGATRRAVPHADDAANCAPGDAL